MHQMKQSFVALCLLAFAGTVGCSTTKDSGGSASAQPAERPRFVFITNSNSPFWDAARKGLDDAGKEFGADVELIRNDSSTAGQIRRLEQTAAQRDVKGVMVSVLEPNASGIIDQMKALRAKGLPVLTLGRGIPYRGAWI